MQQSQKLDEMDLDDILNRAEDHETVAAGEDAGASLGGEGFLATFAAVSDVKNDMNWEDIIPLEDRMKFEKEEEDRRMVEMAEMTKERKRNQAPVSYEGMDVDQPASTSKKPKVPGPTRKTAGQKALELKERDIRVLVRSLQRWGDIRQRYDVIVRSSFLRSLIALLRLKLQVGEAKLADKNKVMILDVSDEIVNMCEREVEHNNAEKRARVAAGEVLTNAQKSKAVLVAYRGVGNINAETVLSRNRDLRILYDYLSVLQDPYTWELPIENIRPTLNWSCHWGPKEDAMLLVGAFLYGFGNWEAIQSDERLGLGGKFFLEEGKKGEDASLKPIPNAIHLVRRGDFLLNLLGEYNAKLVSYETSLKQKPPKSISPPPVHSHATAPSNGVKRRAESEAMSAVDEGGSSKKKKRRPTPTFTDSESSDDCASMDEAATKEELRPVKKQLVSCCAAVEVGLL